MFGAMLSRIPGTSAYRGRIEAQANAAASGKVRAFMASQYGRSLMSAFEDRSRPNWNNFNLFDRDAITDHLPMLRHRSRLLKLEDCTARGLINSDITNVIGPGFKVQASLPKGAMREHGIMPDDPILTELADLAESFWQENVVDSKIIDAAQTRSYLQLCRLRYETVKTDGDLFTRYLMPKGNEPFRIRLVNADCVATPPQESSNTLCRHGITFDAEGALEGYWVHERGNFGRRFHLHNPRNELGLPNLTHYFNPEVACDHRGLPWLSCAMLLINDLSNYLDAELQAKIIEACVALVVESANPGEMENMMNTDIGLGGIGTGDTKHPKITDFPKRQVLYVNKGETVKGVDWSRPGSTFEPFVQILQREMGSGLGRSFERVANNFGAANFSATRVSGIEDDLAYLCEFTLFASNVLDADWEWAMFAAAARYGQPLLRLMRPSWQKYIKRSWNEVADAKAASERIKNKTSNERIEAEKIGNDHESVQDGSVAAEKRLKEKHKANGLEDPKEKTLKPNEPKGDEK